jgi:hypothetical protein
MAGYQLVIPHGWAYDTILGKQFCVYCNTFKDWRFWRWGAPCPARTAPIR